MTQALGMMFFIPLVWGEVLNITAEAVCRQSGGVGVAQAPPSKRKAAWLRYPVGLCRFSHNCYLTVINSGGFEPPPLFRPIEIYTLLYYMPVPWLQWVIFQVAGIGFAHSSFPQSIEREFVLLLFGIPLFILCATSFFLYRLLPQLPHIHEVASIFVCILAMLVAMATIFGVIILLDRLIQRVGNARAGHILGIPSESTERRLLINFLLDLGMIIVYYAYIFDSRNTFNPSWLGAFG